MIDNANGIRTGVQAEIDIIRKYRIKALYYFCDEKISSINYYYTTDVENKYVFYFQSSHDIINSKKRGVIPLRKEG